MPVLTRPINAGVPAVASIAWWVLVQVLVAFGVPLVAGMLLWVAGQLALLGAVLGSYYPAPGRRLARRFRRGLGPRRGR